jgi:hypothetical protein
VGTAPPGISLEPFLLADRFRPLNHVVWTRHADATVLLDTARGRYYTLNEVGGRIWELMTAGEPLVEILRCLGDEYEASAESLQDDIGGLLMQLLRDRLIERVPTS